MRQFTAFATVANYLNITMAAQALRMSQPSLSKLLKSWTTIIKFRCSPALGRVLN